jgi:hypothetical protein
MQMKKFTLFFLLTQFALLAMANGNEKDSEPKPLLIKSWRLLPGYNKIITVDIDTGLLGVQITNPVFKNTLSASYLGNTGLPALSDLFSERIYYTENFLSDHFQYYFHSPGTIRFYNTKRPYTRVGFTTAGPQRKNEKIISLLHTQNIDPGFNIGFLYDNISSDGHYRRQTAKTNALSFFSNLKRDRYLFHAHASINTVQAFENGGLMDVEDLRRAELGTEDLFVHLENAKTELKNSSLFFIHKFQLLGKTATDSVKKSDDPMTLPGMRIGHIFNYNRSMRSYNDIISPASEFYPDYYINPEKTTDSAYYRNLRNDFFIEMPELRIKSFSFGADAGISHELMMNGYSIIPDTSFVFGSTQLIDNQEIDTIIKRFEKNNNSNLSVFGQAATALTERVSIHGSLRYFFAGYRFNDFEFTAKGVFNIPLFKQDVILEPEMKQLFYTPSFFLKNFSSNHFIWNNNFTQVKQSSFGGELIIPALRLKAAAKLYLISDYVFFNKEAVPEQMSEGIEIFTASVDKDFRFWRFNLRSRLALQKSTNRTVIHFPEFISYNSFTFTQELFKKALTVQAGIDIYYNSPYYVPAYQPATSQFYLQNETKYGGYPYIDGFLNFLIKRTRIFIKAEHVNSRYSNQDYFTALGYPRNGMVTRFGLIWNFYD